MFGYVRPLVGDLRVRENEMFRALYCGLCHAMGRHTGCASSLTLSYDFVFLAVLRIALTGENITLEKRRCAVLPAKPRAMAADCDSLAYCARAAALLTYAKLCDDLADERGSRRLAAKSLLPAAKGMRTRALAVPGMDTLETEITAPLTRLSQLERENSDSIDETAACFGEVLAAICAHGLSGVEERIAREIGAAVGTFIYVTDAADDAAEDARLNRYNPIVRRLGTDIFEERPMRTAAESDEWKTLPRLNPTVAEDMRVAALLSLKKLESTAALIDFSAVPTEIRGIFENIAYLGMPAQLTRVLALQSPTNRKDAQPGAND